MILIVEIYEINKIQKKYLSNIKYLYLVKKSFKRLKKPFCKTIKRFKKTGYSIQKPVIRLKIWLFGFKIRLFFKKYE